MTGSSTGVWRRTLKIGSGLVIVGGFAGLLGIALGAVGCESGGVGDPCIPEDEFLTNFPGFNLSEENIESRSFQCQTRICLVNHFQGRVSCPQGQEAPKSCAESGSTCPSGEVCVSGGAIVNSCDPTPCGDPGADPRDCNESNGSNPACGGAVCDDAGRFCHCITGQCPEGYVCQDGDDSSRLCETKVCAPEERDDATRCYVPGTNDPVAAPVCGWCEDRVPEKGVYCSCRCGPPEEGAAEADDNFNFCDCPEGFICDEVRKNVGLGDAQVAGKYCIRDGTKFTDEATDCGNVSGFWAPQCNGLPSGD